MKGSPEIETGPGHELPRLTSNRNEDANADLPVIETDTPRDHVMDLQFKIEIEKVAKSGRLMSGVDYFKTEEAAERGAESYRQRGFTVGPITSCPGEATSVQVLGVFNA